MYVEIIIAIIMAILAFLGVCFILCLSIDIVCWIKPKLSHRNIKGYDDFNVWKDNVTKCALTWKRKMPTVRLKDEERFVLIDILKKQYKHSSVQGWQYAQLLSGLKEVGVDLSDAKVFKRKDIKEIDEGFLLYHAWATNLLSEADIEKYVDEYLRIIQLRTRDNGLIEYRSGFSDVCLVDTLAFVCPLLVKYGLYKRNETLIQKAMFQIETYHKYGYIKELGLYAHAYDSNKKLPCEAIGWGRGTGWYLLGILYCYEEMPEGRKEKDYLQELIKEALRNIVRLQNQDGGWCTQLVGCWNYDSSATAINGYFILRAVKILGYEGQEQYTHCIELAIKKLMSVTTQKGAVEYCEGDCHGIGKYSKLYTISPFTQGMTLLLIGEYQKGMSRKNGK